MWYPHFSRGTCCISRKRDGKRFLYVRDFWRGFKMNPLVLNPSWVTDLIVHKWCRHLLRKKMYMHIYTKCSNFRTFADLLETEPIQIKYPYTDLWYSVSIFTVTQRVKACGIWPFCRGPHLNQTKIKLETDMK